MITIAGKNQLEKLSRLVIAFFIPLSNASRDDKQDRLLMPVVIAEPTDIAR